MSIIKQNSRIQHHRITTGGITFTIPGSEDFTDGTWIDTDLMRGEIGVNMTDDKVFIRTDNGIIELAQNVAAYHGTLTTSGATPTAVLEFTPTGDCVISIEARVSGGDGSLTYGLSSKMFASFKFTSSPPTMTQLGTTDTVMNTISGLEGSDIDTDGVDKVQVMVTGIGGTFMDWTTDIELTIQYV